MSAIKESVAGAARALWVNDIGASLSLEIFLKREPGSRIVWKQARIAIGEPISLIGFAIISTQRRRVADSAQVLVMTCGATSAWLYGACTGQIIDCANRAREADRNIGGFTERHGSRLIAAPGSGPVIPYDKKCSLSDLQRAYDLGFGASGEGWNQEIHPNYINEETYQAERKEALREFE